MLNECALTGVSSAAAAPPDGRADWLLWPAEPCVAGRRLRLHAPTGIAARPTRATAAITARLAGGRLPCDLLRGGRLGAGSGRGPPSRGNVSPRSEEHTSELQS